MRKAFKFIACVLGVFVTLAIVGVWLRGVRAQQSPPIYEMDVFATYQFNTLKKPTGLAMWAGELVIVDSGNHVIRQFDGTSLTAIAGNGVSGFADDAPLNAEFNYPTGIWAHQVTWGGSRGPSGAYREMFIMDAGNFVIRRYCNGQTSSTISCNSVQTFAGSPGEKGWVDGSSPRFSILGGFTNTTLGYLAADSGNHVIRQFHANTGTWTTYAGTGQPGFVDGPVSTAEFNWPMKVAQDGAGNLYVVDGGNFAVRKIDTDGNITTLAGDGNPGYADGVGSAAQFRYPCGIVFNPGDQALYVADGGNNAIRRITLSGIVTTYTGVVTTSAGQPAGGLTNGSLSQAQFSCPMDLLLNGNFLYVSDMLNNVIRRIDMATGIVSTYIS